VAQNVKKPAAEDRRIGAFAELCADEPSFRTWYASALPRVYGYVHGCAAGDLDLAAEITQEAFIAAVDARRSFDGRLDPVNWICSIARHALIDHYRRAGRDRRRHLSLVIREIALDGDARAWARTDARDEMVSALRAVTPDQRAVLVLHYVDGLPVRDIARQLGRSEVSVESLLARGRERLRTLLGNEQ
jgi:RNA polymerase sigma-70 factor (ECF subfamily)